MRRRFWDANDSASCSKQPVRTTHGVWMPLRNLVRSKERETPRYYKRALRTFRQTKEIVTTANVTVHGNHMEGELAPIRGLRLWGIIVSSLQVEEVLEAAMRASPLVRPEKTASNPLKSE